MTPTPGRVELPANDPIAAVLLAGGLARRMGGGDKCLLELGGRTLLARAIERITPQVGQVILNANGDAARFGDIGLPVIADTIAGNAGPLAGVLSGMEWLRENAPDTPWLLTAPTDAPFLPADLVERLLAAAKEAAVPIACAASGGRRHPPIALWDVALAEDLRRAMTEEEIRKVDLWTAHHGVVAVEWPSAPIDPFFNINRPEDLTAAEAALAEPE